MNKLQLPSVTLCCVDCINANRAIRVLEHCKSLVDFGAVKFLTHIPTNYEHTIKIMPLNGLVSYSVFMLSRLHEFIETDNMLIVQWDGFILNPEVFNNDWLKYDYIAPLFIQEDRVGSGGFSLRSRKMMVDVSKTIPQWDGSWQEAHELQKSLLYYEDGVLSLSPFANGYNIAPPMDAANFAQGGNTNPKYYVIKPFGFHGTSHAIDHKTGSINREGNTEEHIAHLKNYE